MSDRCPAACMTPVLGWSQPVVLSTTNALFFLYFEYMPRSLENKRFAQNPTKIDVALRKISRKLRIGWRKPPA
jgi:hypothetical protein